MSILTILKAQLDTFTDGERAIAAYVLDAPERMIRMSSSRLAEETGRSQSSVVKFSQKLGFRGYQEFRFAVGQAAAQSWQVTPGVVHGTIDSNDSFSTTIQKLIGSKVQAMQQTMSVNTEGAVARALELIRAARRIQVAGVGASSLVARDFTYKLQKLGRMVIFDADSHIQVANAATTGPGDLVIALSYSGASIETRRIAETARAAGAKVISITGVQPNQLSTMADLPLYLIADEDKARSSAIFTRDAQLALADLLFIQLVQSETRASDLIHAAEDAVSVLKR